MIQQNAKDNDAPAIVILTGAGISKESGLDTFRDADGIWAQVRLEDVATPEAFIRNPVGVHEFYNHRRRGLTDPAIKPNGAHFALSRLEREWPGNVLLITQNIDDLHEQAGSTQLLHMHGELLKAICTKCGAITEQRTDLSIDMVCSSCTETGGLRPQVVWFGEMPIYMDDIEIALKHCGIFVSIGTSGTVYPAAGFVHMADMAGCSRKIELNLEKSEGASIFDEANYGPATEIVPAFVDSLLAKV